MTNTSLQSLRSASSLISSVFDGYLNTQGFLLHKSTISNSILEHTYRKDSYYIKFEISLYPTDYPYYFSMLLGYGVADFPETDRNAVALWQLAQFQDPTFDQKKYSMKHIAHVESIINQGLVDLKKYGKNFLQGNMRLFKKVLKLINSTREPYKIWQPSNNKNVPIN